MIHGEMLRKFLKQKKREFSFDAITRGKHKTEERLFIGYNQLTHYTSTYNNLTMNWYNVLESCRDFQTIIKIEFY